MREDVEPLDVIELLEDDCARRILVATSEGPRSADALEERCDASRTTVYRRLDDLETAGLLDVQTRPDEEGHHYQVYSTRLERVSIEIADGAMNAEISLREDHVADRFTRMYEEFRP